jgi:hypothetical protein
MKTSNKILLITLAVIGGAVLVTAIVSRIFIGGMLARTGETEKFQTETTSSSADLKGFTEIRASAVWEIDITKGDTWSVAIEAPPVVRDTILVTKEGNALVLDQRRTDFGPRGSQLHARITMPEITDIDFSGAAMVKLSGFTGRSLRVTSSGAGAVVCRDSAFDDLAITLSGVGEIDFSDAKTKHAEVELSGLGSVKLAMAGGELRGSLSGLGSIDYSGTVSSERIEKSGLGSVKHR